MRPESSGESKKQAWVRLISRKGQQDRVLGSSMKTSSTTRMRPGSGGSDAKQSLSGCVFQREPRLPDKPAVPGVGVRGPR